MRASRIAVSLAIVIAAIATVFAQTPGAKSGSSSTSSTSSASSGSSGSTTTTSADSKVQESLQEILEEPNSPDAYRYDPQGRRDPFRSLVGPVPTLKDKDRPPGVPGFLIDEIAVQGILRTRIQGLIALISGPDNKGYIVKVGDKVLDGEVIRITPSSVVFRQEVNDPTRIERFREVIKELVSDKDKK